MKRKLCDNSKQHQEMSVWLHGYYEFNILQTLQGFRFIIILSLELINLVLIVFQNALQTKLLIFLH